LTGTLETRSQEAKEALQNNTLDLTKISVIGTRISRLNTKIESPYGNSKKLNVVRGTKVEPDDINNLAYKNNAVNLIRLLNEYTEDYFNMKIALEKCA